MQDCLSSTLLPVVPLAITSSSSNILDDEELNVADLTKLDMWGVKGCLSCLVQVICTPGGQIPSHGGIETGEASTS